MSLNYESNLMSGNENNVLTNQNLNQNLNKYETSINFNLYPIFP